MRMKNKLIVLWCWLFLGGLTYVYAGDSDVKMHWFKDWKHRSMTLYACRLCVN